MTYEHPLYTPASVAAQRRLPADRHRRVAFAGAYHGWGFHEDGALRAARRGRGRRRTLGLAVGERTPRPAPTPRIYATTIRHARREPVRHIFSYRSYTWLVDLDDLPRLHGRSAAPAGRLRGPRPPRRPAAASCARTSTRFLADHGIDLRRRPGPDARQRPGPRLRASTRSPSSGATGPTASSRASWPRCTTPTATGTPTSAPRRAGPRRAPTRSSTSRRSTTPPATTDARRPDARRPARRRGHPPTARAARRSPRPCRRRPTRHPAPSLRRRSARHWRPCTAWSAIQRHGIRLWLRRLARPAPARPPPGRAVHRPR